MENVKITKGTSYMSRRDYKTGGWYREQCSGHFFDVMTSDSQPVTLFVHRYEGDWQVDCPASGGRITGGYKTQEDAVEGAIEQFRKVTRNKYDAFVIKSRELVAQGSKQTRVTSSDVDY